MGGRYFVKWPAVIICLVFALLLTCPRPGMAGEKVFLTCDDGYRITGIIEKSARRGLKSGIVLLHMYRNRKESWQPLTRRLTADGFNCLAIDMRGHGESRLGPDGRDNSRLVMSRNADFFNQMHLDAEAGVRYLIDKAGVKPGHIGLVGASVGCSVAIHTAVVGRVPVAAVAVMTPGRNYLGIPTMTQIEGWPGLPLLILSSHEEEDGGSRAIYNRLKNRGAEIRIFNQRNIHGTYMFGRVDGVESLISNWLRDKLLKSGRRD